MKKDEYSIMYDIEQSYWWFVGKQFLVKTVLEWLRIDRLERRKILDIGCGTGMVLKLLESFGVAYGIELSSEAIFFSRQRKLNLIVRSDANQTIPFCNDTFSVITCLDVLEHLDGDRSLMEEMFRICKPGGYVIITVPAFDFMWSSHDIALHHKRRYTKQQMLRKIQDVKWKVIKCSYYNTILFLPILFARKLKVRLSHNRRPKSDFFVRLPTWLNTVLSVWFISEIYCFKYLNFPFGVSLLLILQKPKTVEPKLK